MEQETPAARLEDAVELDRRLKLAQIDKLERERAGARQPREDALEVQIKEAQLAKTLAEARIAQRTTPVLETVKLASSLIIGIGGAVAGFAGVQFANAERKEAEAAKQTAQVQMERAKEQTDKAVAELKKLETSQIELKKKIDFVGALLDDSNSAARNLHDDTARLLSVAAALKARLAAYPEIEALVQKTRASQGAMSIALERVRQRQLQELVAPAIPPIDMLVSDIFGPDAEGRLSAFEMLMSHHSRDPRLIGLLVSRAVQDRGNVNGIYNAITALCMLSPQQLREKNDLIEPLLNLGAQIGDRTRRKSQELIKLMAVEKSPQMVAKTATQR